MKILINKESVITLLLLLLIFIENDLFNIIPIDVEAKNIAILLLVLVGLVCTFYNICDKKIRISSLYNHLFIYSFIIFFVVCFPQFIYSCVLQHVEITSFMRSLFVFFYILVAFPILYIFVKTHTIQDFIYKICFITGMQMTLIVFDAFLVNKGMEGFLSFGYELMRNDRLRVWDLSSLEAMVIIFCAYQIMYRKCRFNKGVLWYILVVTAFALYYVEQTRMMQLSVVGSIMVMFLYKEKGKFNIYVYSSMIIISLILYISLGGAYEYVSTFTGSGRSELATYSIRVDEIKYVWGYLQDNWLFGSGMSYFKSKPYAKFSSSDIGVIGLLYDYGLGAFFIFIIPIIYYGVRIWKWRRNRGMREERGFVLAIYFFLLISSATLIIVNETRILMWPFCIAICEYYLQSCEMEALCEKMGKG